MKLGSTPLYNKLLDEWNTIKATKQLSNESGMRICYSMALHATKGVLEHENMNAELIRKRAEAHMRKSLEYNDILAI